MIRTLFIGLLFVALGSGPACADGELPSGVYAVSYGDSLLGLVKGTATVRRNGAIAVELRHPVTGETYHLEADGYAFDGADIVIELRGESPSGPPFTINDLVGEPVVVPDEDSPTTIQLRDPPAGDNTVVKLDILPRGPPPTLNTVTLRLRPGQDGLHAGTWTIPVEQATGRDAGGRGRVGRLIETDRGKFVQQGLESWFAAPTRVFAAFDALPDLTLLVPDGAGQNLSHRYVFIVGENFPERWPDVELRFAASMGANYEAYGMSAEFAPDREPVHAERASVERIHRLAMDQLRSGLPESEHQRAENLDWIILKANLDPGTPPGPMTLKLNGIPVRWVLRYRDATARTDIVRRIASNPGGDNLEPTRELFSPERVYVRVRTSVELPFESLPVSIARNGELVAFAGEPTLTARRSSFDPKVYVTRPIDIVDANYPRYGQTTTAHWLVADPGDVVHATLLHEGLDTLQAGVARAVVYDSPRDAWGSTQASRHERFGGWVEDDSPWLSAVRTAARCSRGKVTAPRGGWGKLAYESDNEIWNVVVFSTDWVREIPVTFGTHAAMLLLKRRFVELMERERQDLSDLLFSWDKKVREEAANGIGPKTIELLTAHKMLAAAAARESLVVHEVNHRGWWSDNLLARYRAARFPLGDYLVTTPSGDRSPYREFLRYDAPRMVASQFGIPESAVPAVLARATGEALTAYKEAIAYARWHADVVVDDCNVEELAKLTGFGFQAVAEAIKQRLVRPARNDYLPRDYWEPDPIARAHVDTVHTFAEAVRAQEELADVDTQLLIAASTAATFGAGAVVEIAALRGASNIVQGIFHGVLTASRTIKGLRTVLAVAFIGADAVDLTNMTYSEWAAQSESRAELRFARAASAVLGGARMYDAENSIRPWSESIANILISGAGALLSARIGARDVHAAYFQWRNGELLASIERGKNLVPRFRQSDDLSGFSATERADLRSFIEDAAATRKFGGPTALTTLQRNALRRFEDLARAQGAAVDAPSGRPTWAQGLQDRVYNDIRQLEIGPEGSGIPRLDLRSLARAFPAELNRILTGQDRQLALNFLRFNACREARWLQNAIARRQSRVTEAVPGVFEAVQIKEQPHLFRDLNWVFEADSYLSPYRDRDTGQPAVTRSMYIKVRVRDPQNGLDISTRYYRSYDEASGTLTLQLAHRRGLPPWFPSVEGHRLTDRGIPTTMMANLMAMWEAGIGFAGGGKPLRAVEIPSVGNAQSTIHLGWLFHQFGEGNIPPGALRELFSYGYAEAAIQQAGYRVDGVRMEFRDGWSRLEDKHNILRENLAEGKTSQADINAAHDEANGFVRQFFGEDWDPNIPIPTAFELVIDVSPDVARYTPQPGRVIDDEAVPSVGSSTASLPGGIGDTSGPKPNVPFPTGTGSADFDPVGGFQDVQPPRDPSASPSPPTVSHADLLPSGDPTRPLPGPGPDVPAFPASGKPDTTTTAILGELREDPLYRDLLAWVEGEISAGSERGRFLRNRLSALARLRRNLSKGTRARVDSRVEGLRKLLEDEVVILPPTPGPRSADEALLDGAVYLHLHRNPNLSTVDLLAESLSWYGITPAPSTLSHSANVAIETAEEAIVAARERLGLPPVFGENDLVYGPVADGRLRELANQSGGVTLFDIDKPPEIADWLDFSESVLDSAANTGRIVRFDLSHMEDIENLLAGTGPYSDSITAGELRYIRDNWDGYFENNVIFYRDNKRVPPPWETE